MNLAKHLRSFNHPGNSCQPKSHGKQKKARLIAQLRLALEGEDQILTAG
ncbi:MAG: hypothetical protein ABSF38_07230 [Verrucomicrobiota bacterium]|jgi:hypothetical protein